MRDRRQLILALALVFALNIVIIVLAQQNGVVRDGKGRLRPRPLTVATERAVSPRIDIFPHFSLFS